MTIPSRDSYSEGCTVEIDAIPQEAGPCLDDYLPEATQRVDAITKQVRQGEPVDRGTRDWMLAQVDFVVETIGNENLELSEDLRSKLLQLLLSIANLNEHIRREASASL